MRPLDEAETTVVFEKLLKFTDNNLKNTVESPARRYCFRLQKNRV
ncbi:unnamed protein product [Linum tenue]|uniref:60S ribosome subunit biogenesis protein NIP7 pre-PUA domain-containing protein n=1 Tax=Linum tenue TaxID=586396 RepID=A0AAV0K8Z0_9ROSI|nr:unnamed protein product [Linum tenue]